MYIRELFDFIRRHSAVKSPSELNYMDMLQVCKHILTLLLNGNYLDVSIEMLILPWLSNVMKFSQLTSFHLQGCFGACEARSVSTTIEDPVANDQARRG